MFTLCLLLTALVYFAGAAVAWGMLCTLEAIDYTIRPLALRDYLATCGLSWWAVGQLFVLILTEDATQLETPTQD